MNMNSLLNYHVIYELLNSRSKESNKPFNWNEVAKMYDGMAKLEKEFTLNQINQIPLTKEDSVVDIGCGPGRLSVPLAKRAKSVTSVDAFDEMLKYCKINAKIENLNNIKFLKQDWNDKDATTNIGVHDVVVVSRTVALSDILRLNKIAKKYVVILSFANDISLREIQLDFLKGIIDIPQQTHPNNTRMFGYNIAFNMIYDMGANPSVVVVDDGFEKIFKSKDEAYEHLRFVGEIPKNKEDIYRQNVDRNLTQLNDGTYHLLRKTKTFVMWWKPEELKVDL